MCDFFFVGHRVTWQKDCSREKLYDLRLKSANEMSLGRALMVMCFCRKQLSDKLLGSYSP